MRKSVKQRFIAKSLLHSTNATPCNNLHIATLEGDIEQVSQLISQNKYDINSTGEHGYTALHFAANTGSLEVCNLFYVRYLLFSLK